MSNTKKSQSTDKDLKMQWMCHTVNRNEVMSMTYYPKVNDAECGYTLCIVSFPSLCNLLIYLKSILRLLRNL